jgi:general secretion pathway protein J
MNDARGFTLVEMLVALLAFSMLAAAAVSILNASLRNKEAFDAAAASMQEIQLARAIVKADLAQMAPRAVRGAYGGRAHTGFVRDNSGDKAVLLSFVRRGWDNPQGAEARSSLQYVEYVLEQGSLVRRSRPYLDPTPDTPMFSRVLFTRVGAAKVSFLSGNVWTEQWRPVTSSADLPKALALDVSLEGFGNLHQAFLTSAE